MFNFSIEFTCLQFLSWSNYFGSIEFSFLMKHTINLGLLMSAKTILAPDKRILMLVQYISMGINNFMKDFLKLTLIL